MPRSDTVPVHHPSSPSTRLLVIPFRIDGLQIGPTLSFYYFHNPKEADPAVASWSWVKNLTKLFIIYEVSLKVEYQDITHSIDMGKDEVNPVYRTIIKRVMDQHELQQGIETTNISSVSIKILPKGNTRHLPLRRPQVIDDFDSDEELESISGVEGEEKVMKKQRSSSVSSNNGTNVVVHFWTKDEEEDHEVLWQEERAGVPGVPLDDHEDAPMLAAWILKHTEAVNRRNQAVIVTSRGVHPVVSATLEFATLLNQADS